MSRKDLAQYRYEMAKEKLEAAKVLLKKRFFQGFYIQVLLL